MAIIESLLSAVSYAAASAAVEPLTGPISDLAGKVAGAANRGAARIAATHAALRGVAPYPTQLPATQQLQTGSWLTEELKRFERRTLRPIGEAADEELKRFERGTLRPIGQWVTENPCESMKMAAFLAFGLGSPQQALAPCPPQQAQQQLDTAKYIRYAVIGAVGIGLIWAFTRRKGAA